jgi:hypothetical protein
MCVREKRGGGSTVICYKYIGKKLLKLGDLDLHQPSWQEHKIYFALIAESTKKLGTFPGQSYHTSSKFLKVFCSWAYTSFQQKKRKKNSYFNTIRIEKSTHNCFHTSNSSCQLSFSVKYVAYDRSLDILVLHNAYSTDDIMKKWSIYLKLNHT